MPVNLKMFPFVNVYKLFCNIAILLIAARFTGMNEALAKLFSREFQRLALENPGTSYNTLVQRAKFLDSNKSTLSRLCSGSLFLSLNLATHFAKKLRKIPSEQDALLREFMSYAKTVNKPLRFEQLLETGDIHTVETFFDRLSNDGSLLVVEYRDLPRAEPDGKYRNYAELAGKAIAAGLSFAMVQPFGDAYEKGKYYHTRLVREYLWRLRNKVRAAHDAMLDAAIKAAAKTGIAEAVVKRRLKLYERVTDNLQFGMNFVSGIQSRMFFAEIPKESLIEREVWEWVASSTRDFFIQRDETSMPRDVIAEQWFPILKYWEANKKTLPQSDLDLEKTIKDNNKNEVLDVNLPPRLWQIYNASPIKSSKKK